MHITNQEQLKRQKRKLSLIFTLILFAVVTWLQIIFLIGRYLDYTNREIQNLENEIFPKHTLQQNMMSESMIWTIPSMPMFGKEWRWRRLKWGNIISYNPQKNLIISSSLWDEEFTRELLQELLKKEETKWTIFYNKNKFLFLKDTTNSGIQSFFLVPIHMQISDVIRDSILFILFFWFLSVLFYRVIYRFVGKLFLPIEENIQDMEQFIFNAGHELKTPLSVTKSHLQLALAKKQYKKSIDESIKEIDKMNDLLEALINLSVIHQEAEKENIDIAQEVDYLVVQYESKAKKKKIKISIKKDKSFDITANKWHINMLISNLISNAIKYNKNWWKIEISINSWEMYVKDTWIWISPKDVEKIFDRFYQVGGVRNQEWFGIWLALVKKIVDMYGWKIDVFSQENIGTTIRIRFN